MKIVFISGPYRAPTPWQIQANIRRAAEVALHYWKQGYAVICPHMNTALFDGEANDNVWLDGAIEIMLRCDLIVMMPGWECSDGARDEYRVAQYHGKEIIYHGDKVMDLSS